MSTQRVTAVSSSSPVPTSIPAKVGGPRDVLERFNRFSAELLSNGLELSRDETWRRFDEAEKNRGRDSYNSYDYDDSYHQLNTLTSHHTPPLHPKLKLDERKEEVDGGGSETVSDEEKEEDEDDWDDINDQNCPHRMDRDAGGQYSPTRAHYDSASSVTSRKGVFVGERDGTARPAGTYLEGVSGSGRGVVDPYGSEQPLARPVEV